jgi:hypothetical protein
MPPLFLRRRTAAASGSVLPTYRDDSLESAIPAPDVTKVALRIHHLIEECIPCELEENQVTRPHSKIITKKVVRAAREAGGKEHRACVVFCLLVNKRWFKHQALVELWDADLHHLRAVACEVIAKQLCVVACPRETCRCIVSRTDELTRPPPVTASRMKRTRTTSCTRCS